MILYAESSAVLAWLLGEPRSQEVRKELTGAELVVTSVLTLVECERALHRAVKMEGLSEAHRADLRAFLERAASHWDVMQVDEEVVRRSRLPFPAEPIRTLDAIHVSSALAARGDVPGLAILSLDERIRSNAAALGFDLRP